MFVCFFIYLGLFSCAYILYMELWTASMSSQNTLQFDSWEMFCMLAIYSFLRMLSTDSSWEIEEFGCVWNLLFVQFHRCTVSVPCLLLIERSQSFWLSGWHVCSGYCVPLLSAHLWVCVQQGWETDMLKADITLVTLSVSICTYTPIATHCCPDSHLW